MSARRLLLVRHGESEWNAEGRWQGQADPALSDLGRRQALAAARTLAGDPPAVAWGSPLARAADTAAVIAEALGLGPVHTDPDLMERHVGEWSGLTRAEIEVRYPGWLDAPADKHSTFGPAQRPSVRRPPGWEADEHVLERALAAVARVVKGLDPGATALVVTHGGLIYVLERHLGGPFARMANLDGRWVDAAEGGTLSLGARVGLVDPEDVAVTVPGQL